MAHRVFSVGHFLYVLLAEAKIKIIHPDKKTSQSQHG